MLKNLLRIALSIAVSFAILGLLLQMVTSGVADEDRPNVLATLQNTSFDFVFYALAIYLITLFIRAYRYRLLLQVSGEQNVPTFKQMALVTGIRNMVVDMLPARVGELGYVGLLNRGYGVKLQHCMSSLTISVAFDFVALLAVVFLIVGKQFASGATQGWAIGALISAIVITAIAIVGLFIITPVVARWLNQRFAGAWQESSWRAKLLKFIAEFGQSIETVRSAGQTVRLVIVSILIRILKYAGFYMLFRAVSVNSFESLSNLPVEHVVSALIGGEIGASLPVPTFMSFGAYEAGGSLIFHLLGVVDQAAVVVSLLCVHIWSQAMEYLIGGALLALFFLTTRQVKQARESRQQEQPKSKQWLKLASLAVVGSIFLASTGFLAWELRAAKKLGSLSAPDVGGVADNVEDWRILSKDHVSNIDGFVVFSSNRDGNHDIFKLDFKDFSLSKLTDHPHTETYPRISPDGKQIVFARAHQPWVSQRNTVAWDVYVKDIESGVEKKVGESGTAPHWVDNQSIAYLQNATKVVKVNVADVIPTVLYESGVGVQMPKGSKLQNPKVNPLTGEIVFTARQSKIGMNKGHWGTAVADVNGNHRGALNGCELSWTADGKGLLQVTPGGTPDGSIRIVSVDYQTLEPTTLINLEGEFVHEYWPKESNDGRYIVFGASRGKHHHEHDTQDYEIFLWKKGSTLSKATRLTFHTGNENWPDVYIGD